MDIKEIFRIAVSQGASDIHLMNGLSPIIRINGTLVSIDKFIPESGFKDNANFSIPGFEQSNNLESTLNQEGLINAVAEDSYEDTGNSVDKYFLSEDDELVSGDSLKKPSSSINSVLESYDLRVVTNKQLQIAIKHILGAEQLERFYRKKDLDFSYQFENFRFRTNLSFEKGNIKMTARIIKEDLPTMEGLDMPRRVYDLLNLSQGLILLTGPTGSGKSTSLAAMVDYINSHRSCNIITFEDPIEFVFSPKKSIISQRQLGTDMPSFASGLRYVLRQDPNVIMVGEMRDLETISTAVTLAETGHLVLATLHTCSASQTIDRIIDIFPPHQQNQIKSQLSLILSAVISQVLVPDTNGGRVAVREVLLNNSAVSNLIREQKIAQIKSVLETQSSEGMISFERSIKDLANRGVISVDTAKNLLSNKIFSS
ncbi:type IV pili twitching motility protein PilT [Candidatus Falkowbacteria bacterium HGW-Falkowbacteria-1]|jgi:twitching motility protein PilT|uniref:Type IV pili twitching motility protein PilT n=1 Tax=Candidatus Falkowbacteria bacterium HGW-Falkowbacteria-1 TaxID=2013768 RepID=A0A2N2E8K6_9BACT|nr:MAG: type IV pili twitching motility protein PilT [Candidatus Falkowbacteria bacterium HGW-Falkowbacteria-1]